VFAFALTSSLYIGYCNISKQLRNLKNEVALCNRRDFTKRLEISNEIPSKKVDLLLEMHSVISQENIEGEQIYFFACLLSTVPLFVVCTVSLLHCSTLFGHLPCGFGTQHLTFFLVFLVVLIDVVQRVVGVAYNVFSAQRISVMILNRQKTHFTVLASKDAEGKEFDATKGLGGVVLASGEIVNVKDAYHDSRFSRDCDIQTGFRTQSLLCAPLIADNETVGVVYVINKFNADGDITEFDAGDEGMLEYFASTASIAIKKAQMYHDAIRSEKNAQALLSVVRSRSSDEVLENVFESTIASIFKLIFPDCISVYVCDPVTQEAWVCINQGGVEGVSVKYGQGIAGTVAITGETIRVSDAYADGRFYAAIDRMSGYKTKSVLCAAVSGFATNSKPVVVIQLLNKLNGKYFTQDDEDSLVILCKELSVSLRLKIEEMSYLRKSTFARNRLDGKREFKSQLEETFLNEFGAVSQCFKFSALVPSPVESEKGSIGSKELNTGDDSVETLRIREIISKWDFNPFTVNDGDLMQYAFQMISDFDLINSLKIDIRKLKSLIMGAHALYHEDAHFHNFKHAWSVMHMSYLILRHGASSLLTPLDILAVLLSALCHDLDHPGTNNSYEIASESELALTYSYDAVLERHHVSMTHRLLSSPNSNILENLTPAEQTYIKEVITSAILATNMSSHFTQVERLLAASKCDPPFDISSAVSRKDLVGQVVHAADLSGQVLPLDMAKVWGNRCLAEFIHQADLEKTNGYPVTEYMASLQTELQRNRAQMGFVSNIVIPLWTALSSCFPLLELRCCQAQSNHDFYAQCVQIEANDAINTSGQDLISEALGKSN
jgi:GAF domain-containing protein